MKLQNLAFEDSSYKFGVYSSSGELLLGSEKFRESSEHAELAKQLDIKRSALYAEVRDNEVLLGCSLLVKILKGREERAVFIKCFPDEAVTQEPNWINKFYTDAITQTEELQSIKYQVIGLWKEGDILTLSSLENPVNPPTCLERKVLSGEQVSVWTHDLSGGISLLAYLIFKLKSVLLPSFSFALSLYPCNTNISAGPGEFDFDFTLEGGEILSYAVDKSANSEEMLSQIQKDGIKEQKDILDTNNLPGSNYSKARYVNRKKDKVEQRTKIVIYVCSFFLFLLLVLKFLLLIVGLLLLIIRLLLLSKISLELAFP